MNGYSSAAYAASFAELGTPRLLPHCEGYLLVRRTPGSDYRDAMGCYPLFCCRNWSRIGDDLEELKKELVCAWVVTDPFGNCDQGSLSRVFDRVARFKSHFVSELIRPIDQIVSQHHRYYARRALRLVDVELCSDPARYAVEWAELYQSLIRRHQIRGIAAFSRSSLAEQIRVPGLRMFRALRDGETAGITLWFVQDSIAYSHLSAYSQAGYQVRAAYALFWSALDHFRSHKIRFVNLGGTPGVQDQHGVTGLAAFKRGWATETRPVYFCGRVFDQETYAELTRSGSGAADSYFPAYRRGEFGS